MTRRWGLPSALIATLLLGHCSSSSASSPFTAQGGTEAGTGATTPVVATGPSCATTGAGLANCGADENETCCTSLAVPGGDFYRSYDGISTNGATKSFPATVDPLDLDKYETTVGRFRRFVSAVVGGWTPAAGSGTHAQPLSDGNGGTEGGWDASWNANIASTEADWQMNLACDPSLATWTSSATTHENLPINCVDWYEAYAFCIWDGGYLPSEAEWNYTAAGGDQQRVYPWSAAYPPGSITLDCTHAEYSTCTSPAANNVGSESPMGDGRWGHADLAGNVFEWTLDWYTDTYAASTCDNCANLAIAPFRVIRGGGFSGSPACLLNSLRESSAPEGRSTAIGLRCARPSK